MRSNPSGALALAAILVVAPAAAGCGSSKKSSSTTTSTPAISKAAFLKRGNAICRKGNREIGTAARSLFPRNRRPSKAELNRFATKTLIPSVQREINGIRALGAPPGDKARVDAVLSSAQSALNKGKRRPALLTTNGPGPFKRANSLARSYGLKACAASS